ncbi:MAG: response regulator [Bradyrhizobium sp.]|uniref:ATP-binding protein n=1 Tax=Bradyrhizobium sp. TaxID=376 RepID=UPI0025BECC42|nr:ATP-binding protein [Bradyrhizobium sp.]MBI5263116.1 response regulator [Bradyrhizobium sp.]
MGNREKNPRRNGAVAPVAAKNDLNGIASPILEPGLLGFFKRLRGTVGLRLLAAVLLFSSLVTLTLTGVQLYLEYDRDVSAIENRLNEIGRSYVGSLAESVWNLDQNQLELQLNGILRRRDIRAVEVRETIDRPNPIRFVVGQRGTQSLISREYPLDHLIQGARHQIGVLYVEATLTNVYRQLLDRTLIILVSQAAKTFLVSFFILYVFHWLVTRHLVTIAEYVSSYNFVRPPPPLRLDRRPPRKPDELDKVIDAFNGMCGNLQHAYGELRQANVELERDLAVREQAEENARKSEQRFRDYAETASDYFWEIGPDLTFTYISDRMGAFGADRDKLIGKDPVDLALAAGADPEVMREHRARVERHEPFRNLEYARRDFNGPVRWVRVNGRPVFGSDGSFLGYRGSSSDVTKQHEAEERLRQSQRMDAIGQLTGGVAHDFNNVLTVITGTIEILEEGVKDRPQLAAVAQLIDDAATRGAEITSQLLTFARRQPLQPRKVDVNGLITETARLINPILGEHIELKLELAKDAWSALADQSQLSAAIINLAVNARDAMPDGGRVTLESANVTLTGPDVSADDEVKPGDFVMIAVTDTGQGIPAEIRDRVFEPFFTTKGVGRGTGLGLSMVYGFARQSGGTVKIDSEEGRGTVIRLYLPRATGQAAVEVEPVRAPIATSAHEKILVVEDDPLVRGYVIAQLGSLGYKTLSASDGAAALALVDQGAQFDLLFTDVIMPGGMNGRQLADAVLKRRPGVRVLYTSGYTENTIAHHGQLDPGIALLKKPYRKSELARKIREVLEGG